MQGVIKVMQAGGQYQVVIGSDVEDVYDQILLNTSIGEKNESESTEADHSASGNKKSSFMEKMTDLISGIFMPFMGAFAGAGLLKGFLVLFTTLSCLIKLLPLIPYFMLLQTVFSISCLFSGILCSTEIWRKAVYFNGNRLVRCVIHLMTALFANKEVAVTFFSFPVKLISYPSSVLPILLTVYAQSKLGKRIDESNSKDYSEYSNSGS